MMTKIHKTKTIILLAMACMIFFGSCKKTEPAAAAPSIIGTWLDYSERIQQKTANVTTFDTTVPLPLSSQSVLSLKSNSYYAIIGSANSGGVYTYTDSILTLVDTGSNAPSLSVYRVTALTSTVLSLQTIDTNSTNPLKVTYITINFSH